MGQAPSTTAELSEYVHTNELLYHRSGLATANISHLPDLSPFPRASGRASPAPPPYSARRPAPTKKQGRSMARSASKHSRQARSARSRAGSVSSRDAASAAAAAVRGARKSDVPRPRMQKRPSATSRRSGVERRKTKERGWKAVCEGQNRAGIVFEPVLPAPAILAAGIGIGAGANTAAPTIPALINIPRIDIVESSPVMRQLSGSCATPAAPGVTPVAAADAKVDTATSPFAAAPPFARSPSMPAVLVEAVPTYMGTPRPVLSRPTSSPASPTAPGFTAALPLPGSPCASAFPSALVNYENPSPGFAQRMLAHGPENGDSLSTSSSSGSEYGEGEEGEGNERGYAQLMAGRDDLLSRSMDSIVTQQIRILRVTNPDPEPEADAPSSAAAPVKGRTPATLAEKRSVPAPPAPLRIVALPSTPQRIEKERYPRLLSPATPSTPTSASSNVLKSGSGSGSGFSTPATSAPSTPVKAARLSAPVDTRALASSTQFDAHPASPVAAFAPSPARKATPVQPASPLPSSRRASYLSRSRSDSHGSSDGDRSGTGSSASGLSSGEHVGKRRRRKGRRGRASAVAAMKVAANTEGFISVSTPARKQQRPPLLPSRRAPAPPDQARLDMPRSPNPTPAPTLVSLNLDPQRLSKSCSLPSLAMPADILPPRSPRPPATPRLEQAGAPRSVSARHLAPPPASTPDSPYALPLPSPVSPLRMDWFTTDLLVRCGIQTSTLAPIPSPSSNRQALSPGSGSYLGLGMGHPTALQPRAVSSPMPLPSSLSSPRGFCPLPGTPLGHSFLDTLELDTSPLFPSDSLDPVLVGNETGSVGRDKANEKEGKRVETPRERRERKHRETQARYEAFDKLAQMAVESPGGNPFVDAGNGAVRLGEYKRGFDDREIWKWARAVSKATLAGEMVDDRKARRKERGR